MGKLNLKDNSFVQLSFWIAIVWLTYGHTIFFDFFVFDDSLHIWNNWHTGVRDLSDLTYFWKNSLTPIIYFAWQLISLVFSNQEAYPFRIFNLLVFGGSAYLLYQILYELFKEKVHNSFVQCLPFIATLFYVLHPSQVESVVWVSSGRSLLATLFALLSFRSYQRIKDESDFSRDSILTVLYFILGLLSKPSILMAPVFMVYLSFLSGKNWKRSSFILLPMLSFGLVIALLHINDVSSTYFTNLDFSTRIIIFLDSLYWYFKISFFPVSQSFDYSRSLLTVLSEWETFGIRLILPSFFIMGGIILLFLFRKTKELCVGIILFFTLLLPNMGLMYFDFQNISTVSNRYLSFPLICISLGIVTFGREILQSFKGSERKVLVYISLPLLFLAITNFNYSRRWQHSEDVLLISGNRVGQTYALEMSLGFLFFKNDKYVKAEKSFNTAWEIDPTSYEPVTALIELYQHYNHLGKLSQFLSKIEDRKIPITPDRALEVANLYFSVNNFEQAYEYAKMSFVAGVKAQESQNFMKVINEKSSNQLELNYIQVISILFKKNNRSHALKLLESAMLEFPNSIKLKEIKENVKPPKVFIPR